VEGVLHCDPLEAAGLGSTPGRGRVKDVFSSVCGCARVLHACLRACVRACACMRACVRACVRVCVCVSPDVSFKQTKTLARTVRS